MKTLTGRLVALAMVVAVASVLVTGIAMLGLFRQGADEGARTALGRDADTIAATVETLAVRTTQLRGQERVGTQRLRRLLALREIRLAIVEPGDDVGREILPAPITAADITALREVGTMSSTRRVTGSPWLFEGRVLNGTAVLLAQPLARATADLQAPRRRIVIPLVLGLAGGAIAGLVLARQLSRPLAAVAVGARRLTSGQRDVRVPPEGPAEVADVAHALNALAAALAGSEARQRRFLLDVSHELRTPLTAVSGYAEALADGVITGPEVPAAAEVIKDEAGRLRRRVEDLLALARMEADDFRLEPAPTDVTELVRAAARAWQARAEAAAVDLTVEAPDTPLVVMTDAERVRQAVDALVDNALRVLTPGAPLVIACRALPGGVAVQVRDGGPGLAPEDLAVAFERGRLTERYRGDRPVGSGLGLALVGELSRRLGGAASAAPAPEGGVAFTIELPAGATDGAWPPAGPNTPRTFAERLGHLGTPR